jgi:hypothetical protein
LLGIKNFHPRDNILSGVADEEVINASSTRSTRFTQFHDRTFVKLISIVGRAKAQSSFRLPSTMALARLLVEALAKSWRHSDRHTRTDYRQVLEYFVDRATNTFFEKHYF